VAITEPCAAEQPTLSPGPPDSMPAALSFRADPTVVTSTTTTRF